MTLVAWARAAKICALVGFTLPWVMVSCSGSAVQTETGWSLAKGHPDPNWWVLLAMAAIVGGLVFSVFPREGASKALGLLIASVAAALLIVAGITKLYFDFEHHFPGSRPDAQVVRFETRYGLWLTLASLTFAAGLSGAALGPRDNG